MVGRLAKLKADLRACAGIWSEALRLYEEAFVAGRASGDSIWAAGAVEGIACLRALQTWWHKSDQVHSYFSV